MANENDRQPSLAALFVDFDNIIISLEQQSKHIANQFAANPDKWLKWLEQATPSSPGRSILIRRCYLNPQSFAEFRPYFIRSAFEVIDCPPLTTRGKTSTDIHLVMDVLDTLNHPTNFTEFIIFSGDADFTPVLLRLRKHNRRTSVLTAGYYVSPAYKASCDYLISLNEFIRDGLGLSYQEDEEVAAPKQATPKISKSLLVKMSKRIYEAALLPQGIEASELPKIYREFSEFKQSDQWLGYQSLRGLTDAIVDASGDQIVIVGDDPWRVCRHENGNGNTDKNLRQAIAAWIQNIVSESPNPVTMASLAGGVTQRFGPDIRNSDWLGAGTFKSLLTQLDLGELSLLTDIPGYVYDPNRHSRESTSELGDDVNFAPSLTAPAGPFSIKYPDLAPLAWKINQLTDTPYLLPEHYAIVLREIAREINENENYQWARTSKTVRDRCVEKGIPVARSHVNFILTGLYYSGYPLGKEIPVDISKLATKLVENTIALCRNAQFQLSESDISLIETWMTPM